MGLDRRNFVTVLLCTAALPVAGLASRLAAQGAGDAIDVVERFGFVPDGRTDNYAAFHRWAAHVNRVGGGNYLFPPGTYVVTRHRTRSLALRDPATVINSMIDRVDGLMISGYGARIRLNGAFHRSGRAGPDGVPVGMHYAIFMPFEIQRSRNVTIKGFEMDGGVREMSRDRNVGEIYAALIALHSCTGVLLQDLDLHHSQTDAVFITSSELSGVPTIACRDVTLRNVKAHDNARGGLGVIHVLGLLCVDCAFNRNGIDGKYLGHAPQFGVDVEPDHVNSKVDVRTGDLEFRNCEFMDNFSGGFLAGYASRYQGYLRVIGCRSSNRFGGDYPFVVGWPGALIEGGVHDVGDGVMALSWQGETGGNVTVRDCEIRASGLYGVSHYWDGNLATLERVRIMGSQKQAGSHGEMLLFRADPGRGRRNVIRDCEIFIPAARKSRAHPFDYEVLLSHTLSERNLFRTDLPAGGGQHFAIGYDKGAVARGDRFRGSAPGTADSIRPGHNSVHDTRAAFSSG